MQRRLTTILAADVAGYSRLASADEEGTVSRLRALRQELVDPVVAANGGRVFKDTGDGRLAEFASVVGAVRCALEVQRAMAARNANVAPEKRIEFRVGIHLGDVIVESDGDLMGDGVNIAARLEGICEPGGICLSEDAYRQVRDKVGVDFIDLGDKELKNIARPVRAYGVNLGRNPTRPTSDSPPAAIEALPLPDKPSIAVLPFTNMSGDPDQEYFADGVVEDIISGLSRIKWLFVIARNSSFTYKGRAVDLKQVGRELGVRYVLEGSVRKAANHVRITCQLIEATTGAHIWSNRFDGDLSDVFTLQDEITQNTVAAIEPNLRSAEIARSKTKPTESLVAYDLYLRALSEFNANTFTKEGLKKAEALLRQALKQDPDYAEAWALLAECIAQQIFGGWISNQDEATLRCREAALRGVDADPQNGSVLASAAYILSTISKMPDRAAEFRERALILQPSSAGVLTNCGVAMLQSCEFDRAISCMLTARRLSPLDPRDWLMLHIMAAAHFFERRFSEADKYARQPLEKKPGASVPLRFLVAALAASGQIEAARAAAADLMRRYPTTSIARSRRMGPQDPATLKILIDALQMAGLPE
jgi:adenylate cyclase